MAKNIAVPGKNLSWQVAANWSLGAVPVATNEVIFKRNEVYKYTTGPAASVNLASLIAEEGSIVQFPSTFVMEVNNSGSGVRWAARGGNLPLSGNTNKLAIVSPLGIGPDGPPVVLVGGTHSAVIASNRAHIHVGSGAVVTRAMAQKQASIEMETNATALTRIDLMTGASMILRRNMKAGTMGRAILELRDGATISDSTNGYLDMTDINALLRIIADADITLDDVRNFAGMVDPRQTRGNVTLTKATRTPESNIVEDWDTGSLSIGTATDFGVPYSMTGRFLAPQGE